MNKIYNWLFGSFFRTLGRILVYIFFGALISMLLSSSDIKLPNFFGMFDVHADVPFDVHIGYDSAKQTWFSGARNISTGIYDTTCDECTPPGMDKVGTYGYIKICTNAVIPSYYSNNEPNINNLEYYNTNVPCNFGTMRGTIRYFTFGTEWSCSVTGSSCTFGYSITWYQNDSADYYVIDANSMNEPIQIDMASGIIINNQSNNTSDIINNNNNNTNNIINNQNQNKNDIINNQNNNTNNIINNQNQNTDKEIESQKVCKNYSYDDLNWTQGSILNQNGVISSQDDNRYYYTSDYYKINKLNITNISNSARSYTCFYDSTKTLISCVSLPNFTTGNYTLPYNTYYVRFSNTKFSSTNFDFKFSFEICENGNQAIGDSINDLGDKITDSTPPSNLDSLNNSAGWLPPGPVDSILNLPLSFLTNLNSNLSKSCQPVNLPLPYIDKILPLPCVSTIYSDIDGLDNWINIIGTIASAFILFGYLINLYKYVDDTLTFRENNYLDNWSGV